ncbi:ParA family protein [Sphaerisporangium fuscum]|uniref:ParA family protein n=1 Tax=Sphaerisporangium fuscum TaxID=2835868 RepID=UPI001BDD30BE|nr:ParA family protein [Sphaerisporangium fuscum]
MTETNTHPAAGEATEQAGDGQAALARVIAIANDKGGVGKTSITANLAALYATAGYKVLALDLNRQANLSDDLGYRGSAIDDQGAGLLAAIMTGQPIRPVPVPGRPGLDVAPGGVHLGDLTGVMVGRVQQQGRGAFLALARALAPAVGPYDLVLADTPPENTLLVDLALGAARWLLMPTKSDGGGLVGMQLLAERFAIAREINPSLALLGVVLFATARGATAIHRSVRSDVETAFGVGSSPVLTAIIGHSERIAMDTRALGRVAHELESDAANQPSWWEVLRASKDTEEASASLARRIPPTASNVAEDYRRLAAEVLDLLAAAEGATA